MNSDSLNPPDAILFDLDGTLVDSEPLHWQSVITVLEQHGVGAAAHQLEPPVGWSDGPFWAEMRRRFDLPSTVAELCEARTHAFICGMEAEGITPTPGVALCLEHLCDRGVTVALVSASPMKQVMVMLKALGLDGHFACIVSGHDDTPRNKPHPEPYLNCAERLALPISACWAVEDSPTGVRSAYAAGARVFALAGHDLDPDVTPLIFAHLGSVGELVKWV